jgi:hypothetical protein
VQVGQEIFAQIFVVVVERFEGEYAGDDEEDVGVGALDHVPEPLVFFRDAFNGAGEMQQVTFLLAVAEVVPSLLPAALILDQCLNQIRVILELGVYHLDVFVVFAKEGSQGRKGTSYLFAQDADGLGLVLCDSP